MNEGAIGKVIGVHGFRVRVELSAGQKSAVRADLDGTRKAVAINALVTFAIGPGESALGVITDLDSRETYDPETADLSLELAKPRRVVTVQLLGTVREREASESEFDPGITMLPTLDTLAIPARESVLATVFEAAPKRNRPNGFDGGEFDTGIRLGHLTGSPDQAALGSYNDLFSRPLAVVGNTGSGKSCSIVRLIQEATREHEDGRPRFFVLDINGEYSQAFGIADPAEGRQPNHAYINGLEFTIPLWLFNAAEVCEWLSAAEQVQEPTLKNLWSYAKGRVNRGRSETSRARSLQEGLVQLENLAETVRGKGPYKGRNALRHSETVRALLERSEIGDDGNGLARALVELLVPLEGDYESFGMAHPDVVLGIDKVREAIEKCLNEIEIEIEETADKPSAFRLADIRNPTGLIEAARAESPDGFFRQNLRGLQLRLANRFEDHRWSSFINFEALGVTSLDIWLGSLREGETSGPKVSVIDLGMLADEVLPYACGVIGRVLLELRQHGDSMSRFHEPWVIVLEEAHNYVRPPRQMEARGLRVSRTAFERIAKEGRKFGVSLIVASQRPSEVSETVLSQCANIVIHRLQNPEDIEHFRRIVSVQSRRLLDQVMILGSGEAIAVGSAFNVPCRIQMDLPAPEPSSQSSTPFLAWAAGSGIPRFDRVQALRNWGLESDESE